MTQDEIRAQLERRGYWLAVEGTTWIAFRDCAIAVRGTRRDIEAWLDTFPALGETAEEALRIAVAGRRTELLKAGKTFDTTRLIKSDLFQGQGGPQHNLFEKE